MTEPKPSSSPSPQAKEFVIRLRPLTGDTWRFSPPPDYRLRGALKLLLRRFGLQCVGMTEEREKE